jgi:hypothetical protein
MSTKNQCILLAFFTGYLLMLWLTPLSLVGFWTDIILAILLSVVSLIVTFRRKAASRWLTITLRLTASALSTVVFGLIFYAFTNIFILDTFKLRSFYYQKVDGRIFHAYFKPVGAYAGGWGNFWITESPKYFPIVEWQVYYDRTVHWDFGADSSEGQPVDNYEVVRDYIKDEVIDKHH